MEDLIRFFISFRDEVFLLQQSFGVDFSKPYVTGEYADK
jgi:hypothetical protein